jgi:hypothetical protein
MEVAMKESFLERIKNIAFKEKVYFLKRREINWASLAKCGMVALFIGVVGILLIPAPKEKVGEFYEQTGLQDDLLSSGSNPTQETLSQLGRGGFAAQTPSSLDYLYAPSYRGGGSGSSGEKRDSPMIMTRGGLDSKTQIPPGSRISVKLYERAVVASQGMPVIGVVTHDFVHEDSVAVPKGSKLFGDVSFDESEGRAQVNWKSIQFPDGRERPFSALGVGPDGQVGVPGQVHSEALKNTIGQAVTRFIGAYAEGSMQKGALGGNPGGSDNGWKNAIAETAKDRAENWTESLKKEKQWIEVSNSTGFYAVLTEAFAFRDPGSTYGR